jgi:hypothetical protein
MNDFFAVIGATIVVVLGIFAMSIAGTIFGAFAGFVVGLVFTPTFHVFMTAIGMKTIAVWELGAVLGFVGGFFRTVVPSSNKNNG